MAPPIENKLGCILPVTPALIKHYLDKEPDIEVVFITTPTYDGLSADIAGIKAVIGDRIFMVDEAHGAINYFNKKLVNAMASGADMAAISVHKTGGSSYPQSLVFNGKNSRI